MRLKLALINLSSAPNEDMVLIASAILLGMKDVSDAWGLAPVEVAFFAGAQLAPIGWTPLVALEQPDQPGVEGYHDVDEQGRAYGRAFLSCVPGRVTLHDPAGAGASLAGVLSHEAAEMALDVLANAYQDGPFVDPASGKSYAQVAVELADPVQEQAYQIQVAGKAVDFTNFIYPEWFNRRALGAKYDHMGRLARPLTLAPGGYVIVRGNADEDQVFGRLARVFRGGRAGARRLYHERKPAEWRDKMKLHHGGRTRRRLVA